MSLGSGMVDEAGVPTPADVSFSFSVALLLRDGLEEYRRLLSEYEERGSNPDLRAAALGLAQAIAAHERLAILTAGGLATLSAELSPLRALAALRQLCYALVSLGQENPDTSTLLSEAELAGILRERDVRTWLDGVLALIPDDFSPL